MNGFLKNETQKEIRFIAYCVELFKSAKGLTGAEVSDIFTKHGVWDYIYDCYGALHVTSPSCTVEDISSFIIGQNQ